LQKVTAKIWHFPYIRRKRMYQRAY